MNNSAEAVRILIIERDSDVFLASARDMEKEGILPVPAHSVAEALQVLEDDPIDVLILNDNLPDITGAENIRLFKDRYPKIEILVLAAHITLEEAIRGVKQGVFDYEEKPVDLKRFIRKIRQAGSEGKISEVRRREEAFRLRAERQGATAEKLAALGTLAAGMAHEINNPLAIIKESTGWLRMLMDKDSDETFSDKKECLDTLDVIDKSIERAKNITHQLMGVIRRTDGKIVQIDLNELVRETIKLNRKRLSDVNIDIENKAEKPSITIWCDPNLLRQILTNLIMNACEAVEQDGDITIILKQLSDSVTLEVQDTGKGIPRENLERIFEPFYSTKPPGKGTGLGLFVVKDIVDSLAGAIHVESEVGHGTRIRIRLPKFCKLKEDLSRNDVAEHLTKILNQNPLKL